MDKNNLIVQAVLLADNPSSFVTRRVSTITIDLGGIPSDRHYGLLRPADSRQKIYPRGTTIANRRQISIVSVEECAQIASHLNVPEILPEWLGANILISNYQGLTQLSRGARMIFPEGTGLICEGENLPCLGPGRIIESYYNQPGLSAQFVSAAKKRRGIICSVEREGSISKGNQMKIIQGS